MAAVIPKILIPKLNFPMMHTSSADNSPKLQTTPRTIYTLNPSIILKTTKRDTPTSSRSENNWGDSDEKSCFSRGKQSLSRRKSCFSNEKKDITPRMTNPPPTTPIENIDSDVCVVTATVSSGTTDSATTIAVLVEHVNAAAQE